MITLVLPTRPGIQSAVGLQERNAHTFRLLEEEEACQGAIHAHQLLAIVLGELADFIHANWKRLPSQMRRINPERKMGCCKRWDLN